MRIWSFWITLCFYGHCFYFEVRLLLFVKENCSPMDLKHAAFLGLTVCFEGSSTSVLCLLFLSIPSNAKRSLKGVRQSIFMLGGSCVLHHGLVMSKIDPTRALAGGYHYWLRVFLRCKVYSYWARFVESCVVLELSGLRKYALSGDNTAPSCDHWQDA